MYTSPHTKFLFSVAFYPGMAPGTAGFNLMQVLYFILPNVSFNDLPDSNSYLLFSFYGAILKCT